MSESFEKTWTFCLTFMFFMLAITIHCQELNKTGNSSIDSPDSSSSNNRYNQTSSNDNSETAKIEEETRAETKTGKDNDSYNVGSTKSDQYINGARQTRATTKRHYDNDGTSSTKSPSSSLAIDEAELKKRRQKLRQELDEEEAEEELAERERAKRRRLKHKYDELMDADMPGASKHQATNQSLKVDEIEHRKHNQEDEIGSVSHSNINNNNNKTSIPKLSNESTTVTNNLTSSDLDPRSPTGKKLLGLLNDTKWGKNRAPTTTTIAPIYSKITRRPNQGETYENETYVQVQTRPSNVNMTDLDWSKLVKVVFKGAKDNQTLYTVVMNSSELKNHPINDWSKELPQLLSRDFEKLVEKWSNVFPPNNLLLDLNKILANISSSDDFISKLNETHSKLASNGSISNMTTFVWPHLVGSNLIIGPSSSNRSDMSLNDNSSLAIDSKNNNFTSSSPKQTDLINHNQTSYGHKTTNSSDLIANKNNSTDTKKNSSPINQLRDNNKPLADAIKELNTEHTKIEDDVKEQSHSLRNFIIICSIGTAIGTSMIVAIILKFLKR